MLILTVSISGDEYADLDKALEDIRQKVRTGVRKSMTKDSEMEYTFMLKGVPKSAKEAGWSKSQG
jgi:hypothetical protein